MLWPAFYQDLKGVAPVVSALYSTLLFLRSGTGTHTYIHTSITGDSDIIVSS